MAVADGKEIGFKHFSSNESNQRIVPAVASGEEFSDAMVAWRRAGTEPQAVTRGKSTGLLSTSFQIAGGEASDAALNGTKIELSYKPPWQAGAPDDINAGRRV